MYILPLRILAKLHRRPRQQQEEKHVCTDLNNVKKVVIIHMHDKYMYVFANMSRHAISIQRSVRITNNLETRIQVEHQVTT